jgi:hypothetical protein
MKTRIKKIIIVAASLLFVGSGVSFAHDRDDKPPGKAYGHYKVKKHHHGWNNKQFKPKRHHRERYSYKENHHHHHHYENHHRRWNNKHFKPRRHHRKRYVYKEIHHHHHDYKNHHRRPAPREAVIYKADLKDPKIIFKVILKGHRLF